MKTLFVGDVTPTEVTAPLFAEKRLDTLFSDVRSLFDGKDFTCANLECALTESEHRIPKFGPNLKGPAETAEVLRQVGVHCCGLSNNHIFDFGIEGYRDTVKALDKAGLAYTGFGENYEDSRKDFVFEKNGERLCVIAVCEHEYSYALENRMGARPFDEFDTVEDVRLAKETCDRVVVLYHGGKEYSRYPSPRLRRLCRALVRNGADMVLCQHTHCIGTYEQYEGGHILYGQGNFHFVKPSKEEGWYTGLAVAYDSTANTVEFLPICMGERGISLAKGEERDAIMTGFASRNSELHNGKWKDGWHAFCERVSPSYLKRLRNAGEEDLTSRDNAVFGHYLDCEAHTDVYRELFPTYNQTNET